MIILGLWMKYSLGKYFELNTKYASLGLPILFLLTGIAVFVVSLMAFNCTAKGHPKMLYTYSSVLFTTFLIVFSFGIAGYVYRSDLSESFRKSLETALSNYDQTSILSKDVDRLQQLIGCCGVNNYTDYYAAAWAKNETVVPGKLSVSPECRVFCRAAKMRLRDALI